MFKRLLDYIVRVIYKFHQFFLSLNDKYGVALTDKQLHFIVIGSLGVALLLVIYPIFKWLAKKNMIITISWIYVFTILLAFTLFIEIGQGVSGTGDMEFADIVAGLMGFIIISLALIIVSKIILWIFKKK